MTTRTFAFEPPRWRPVSRLLSDTLAALAAGVAWLALYSWLGYRLWNVGLPLSNPLNLALGAGLIVAAVVLLLVWRELGRRWLRQLHPSAWRALNQRQMLALSPAQFEEYVARRLFERQGYKVLNTPDTRDGGVDILVTDTQGNLAVVQCKRYRGAVGEETLRDLYGAMFHAGAERAYLVTTGTFTQSALRWAEGKPMELIDGERLARLGRTT